MSCSNLYNEFFENEIQIHYEYIYKFLMAICGDCSVAGDMTQETMTAAWANIRRVYMYSNVKSALLVIARNKLYDYYKKNNYQHRLVLPTVVGMPSVAEDNLVHIIKNEDRKVILKAIGKLKKSHKQVILLRYYYGQSFCNVAKLLDTNYNTILSHHRRALLQLKKALLKEKK